ncbi:MAG TPA: DinB family protein [Chloroflexota bacterium]|nr:DinB family protein [Chloroflexota bacterium]
MTQDARAMFLQGFDYTNNRLVERLRGLSDDEYLWKPVPACWTIVESDEGYRKEWEQRPDGAPEPVTTIAWRLCHISLDVLGGFTVSVRSGQPPEPASPGCAANAAGALDLLGTAYGEWRAALAAVDEDRLWRELGPSWGPFGSDSTADLVLHVFDEFIHHSAEVALLRDLYRSR